MDKLSTECREASRLVDLAKASYSGSELTYHYAYPVYTKYSTKYNEDYAKVDSFSHQYSVLTASKEKAYADFEERFGLPKGSVTQATQWGDFVANTTALVGTTNIGKPALNGNFSKTVPDSANANSKLPAVGDSANYKTVKVDFNKSLIKGSNESHIVNNLESNTYYELSNGTKFKTNNYGYVEEISYTPINKKMPRDKRQTAVGKEGFPTDVGGHIQACSHGGTCDRYDFFPQDGNFNNSAYKVYFENITGKALKEGKEVSVNTRFIRNNPSSSRPDQQLEIQFSIDGVKQNKLKLNNEAGKHGK